MGAILRIDAGRDPQHPTTNDALQIPRRDQPITMDPTELAGGKDRPSAPTDSLEPRPRSIQFLFKSRHVRTSGQQMNESIKRLSNTRRNGFNQRFFIFKYFLFSIFYALYIAIIRAFHEQPLRAATAVKP
jgi:hypothetical protein